MSVLIKSMCGTQDASRICHFDHVNLICGELGGFRRGKHSAALFHHANQDVRMAVHGDILCDGHCQMTMDSITSTHTSQMKKNTAKDMGTLGIEDSDAKSLLLLNLVFRVGTDQTEEFLDIELDLKHAPLIIKESGCNANTKIVSTPREKLQDKLVLNRRRSPILKKADANTMQICMHETFLFGLVPLKCSTVSVRETRSCNTISKTRTR